MITYPLTLGDRYTRVLEYGAGPVAIVLVHGLGARADRWRRNIGPLAEAGYRCVAFDLPVHSFASKDGDFEFTVRNCARFVADLMTELDIGGAVLIGTSMGGYIAAHMVCAGLRRVEALALVGTIGIVPMELDARHTLGARFGGVTRDGIERKLRNVMFDDDLVGERLAALPDRPPIAVIWGREDRAIPLSTGHACRDLLSPELFAEIPDAAHAPYFERPEAFNAFLFKFLSEQ